MATDAPYEPADMASNLGAGWRLASSQQHRDGATGRGVVDMDRQKAPLAMMAVPKTQLLHAVSDITGVIDIERDRRRRRGIAGAVNVDQRASEPNQLTCGRRILPARHCWLAGKANRPVRQFAERQFEPRIMAQRVEIVGIFVAASDRQDPGAQYAIEAMGHTALVSGIGDATGKSPSNPNPPLGLSQK
jgi:hypothetical protein